MTTEHDVMTILERANPLPSHDAVEVPVDGRRYLDAIQQRSEPMTLIETTSVPPETPKRRPGLLLAAAAAVVALVVAAVVVVANDGDTDPVPATDPTVPETDRTGEAEPTVDDAPDPEEVAAAIAVVEAFNAAHSAGDLDTVTSMLDDGVLVTAQLKVSTADAVGRYLAWEQAQGTRWTEPVCEPATDPETTGTTLSCVWGVADAMVQAVGSEPYPSSARVVVVDDALTEIRQTIGPPDFVSLYVPMAEWAISHRPELGVGLYSAEYGCCHGLTIEESVRRGEIRREVAFEWAAWLDEHGCEPLDPCEVAEPTEEEVAAAIDLVEDFSAAYTAGDTETVMSMFSDDVLHTRAFAGDPDLDPDPNAVSRTVRQGRQRVERLATWEHAFGTRWTEPACELADEQRPAGATLWCEWDEIDNLVRDVDGIPIPTRALIVVLDDAVAEFHTAVGPPAYGTLMSPFTLWLSIYHPEVSGVSCCEGATVAESQQRGETFATWTAEWGAWLDRFGCEPTDTCTTETDDWVAEYDARCTLLDPADVPTADLYDEMRLIPRPPDPEARRLLRADAALLEPDLTESEIADRQAQRLELMVALGIDERCHPVIE